MRGVIRLLLVTLIAVGGAHATEARTTSSGAPVDTFLTGCELVLFGREVEPVVRNGQSGYYVTSDDSTVSINGILYFNRNTRPPTLISPIDPEIVRKSRVMESAIKIVDLHRNENTDEVTLEGVTRHVGESFSLDVPDHQAQVSVSLYQDGFAIKYEGLQLYCSRHQHQLPDTPKDPVESTARWIVGMLRGHRLVIMGTGYAATFPLEQAPPIRVSLSKIPAQAELLYVDGYGKKQYKPLTIDGYLWDGGIVRDVVESNSSSK